VSTIAALSARFSGTSSVEPSGEIASRSGQAIFLEFVGGKLCGVGAPDCGGTGMTFTKLARPSAP
jgi:hypothetical protein